MSVLERDIEKKCRIAAQRRGWMMPKFTSPGLVGVPDRILLRPGMIDFIEFKSAKGSSSKRQKVMFQRMDELGFKVVIIRSYEEFEERFLNRVG